LLLPVQEVRVRAAIALDAFQQPARRERMPALLREQRKIIERREVVGLECGAYR
jgi:hypothetical protein